ncbi:MAG: HAD-IIIA family hydrolase [bacterium]
MENKAKKIVFLDRDGVINKKAKDHEYITRIEEFVINDGIFAMLDNWKEKGYEFIVITNQRGIARGKLTDNDFFAINNHMIEILKSRSLELLDVLYCPHEENVCDCRKPKPGMLEFAIDKYAIDLPESALISDSLQDVEMGKKFGIGKNILVKTDSLEILQDN